MRAVDELFRPAAASAVPAPSATRAHKSRMPHPIVMLLLIIATAVLLTWIVPSGAFLRDANGHATGLLNESAQGLAYAAYTVYSMTRPAAESAEHDRRAMELAELRIV